MAAAWRELCRVGCCACAAIFTLFAPLCGETDWFGSGLSAGAARRGGAFRFRVREGVVLAGGAGGGGGGGRGFVDGFSAASLAAERVILGGMRTLFVLRFSGEVTELKIERNKRGDGRRVQQN